MPPRPTTPVRLVVLASGSGTNAEAVITACRSGQVDADVAAVVTDRPGAGVVARAAGHGVPVVELPVLPGEHRPDYDARLAAAVAELEPDLVVMLGWMRLLTATFLDRFSGTVINLHPALPGEFPGTRALERAWNERRTGRRARTGAMVHLVPDEGVDDGPVLATTVVAFRAEDTFETFTARFHLAEHRLVVGTLAHLCGRLSCGARPAPLPHLDPEIALRRVAQPA
jgi:phosphoribosylglycinamide formyltransferase-1